MRGSASTIGFLSAGLFFLLLVRASAFQPPQKSISNSGQFVIYCDDSGLRFATSSFVEQTKAGVLKLLDLRDSWKAPIVVEINRSDATSPGGPASLVQLCEVEDGFKVAVIVSLGKDPSDVKFQQQIVKAILLEIAYRAEPARAGTEYKEPPAWLIEGMIQYLQSRENGTDPDVFRAVIDTNRLMPIGRFLSQSSEQLDSTSLALYQAYSLSLVQLLIDLPGGRACLLSYVRGLSRTGDAADPGMELTKYFPGLADSSQSFEKWWALSMARLSAANRFKGLSVEESDRRLKDLLSFQLPATSGTSKVYSINDFKELVKQPQGRQAYQAMSEGLMALSANAQPLLRPIVSDYQKLAMDLAHGKGRGANERLTDLARRRDEVIRRVNDIADYLNWFEATQMTTQSDSFSGYIKVAKQLNDSKPRRQDAMSRYLDAVALEYQ